MSELNLSVETNLVENPDSNNDKNNKCDSENFELKYRNTDANNQKSIELTPELKEKIIDHPDVLSYIEKLQRIIQKQVKKIIKWKMKVKEFQERNGQNKTTSIGTQTDFDIGESTTNNVIVASSANEKSLPFSLTEDIKEAAEQAMHSSGFVYEETSGLYYDYNTGYYYNAEYGLYYDGASGTYLKYNPDTQVYEFYSQASEAKTSAGKATDSKVKRKSKKEKTAKDIKRRRPNEPSREDLEEGECSESGSSSSEDGDSSGSDSSDICKQWPPCMRLIVESTDIPKIKVGSLHMITCDGGTVGREGNHSVLLPDINVSKHHLKISFEKSTSKYMVTDLGSRNGTVLNSKRLSPSKQESEPIEITHGSKLQIGSTVLLCHIHDGNQTCGHCEPGLLIEEQNDPPISLSLSKQSVNEKYRSELKKLKKQHGFLCSADSSKLASGYTDRAQKRRDTVGSQNPYEKTQTASLDESISSQNKGFKLLSKMGWKEGQSLGKDGIGTLEPVKLLSNVGTSGIGATGFEKTANIETKQSIWKKTQERFEKLPDANIFEEDLDS